MISGFSSPAGYNGTYIVATVPTPTTFTVTGTTTGTSSGTGSIAAEVLTVGGGGSAGFSVGAGGAATFSGTAFPGANASTAGGGGGGTQTAGGAAGTGSTFGTPNAGSLLQGGFGAQYGGGGGGGYFGGGGGATVSGNGAGGGGGSSYITNTRFTLIVGSNSPNSANQAPGTAVLGYQTGVAAGGISSQNGGNGLIILSTVGNALSEVMRFSSSGNIGIGTSAPRALLDVAGAIYGRLPVFDVSLTSQTLTVGVNDNSYFYIRNSGFSNIVTPASTTTAQGGMFWTFKNSTSSFLSVTLANTLSLASPITISPSNAVTLTVSPTSANTLLLF